MYAAWLNTMLEVNILPPDQRQEWDPKDERFDR
jgi:hypothetical protein